MGFMSFRKKTNQPSLATGSSWGSWFFPLATTCKHPTSELHLGQLHTLYRMCVRHDPPVGVSEDSHPTSQTTHSAELFRGIAAQGSHASTRADFSLQTPAFALTTYTPIPPWVQSHPGLAS